MECLRSYRKRWNEELKVYSDTPLHDFASHSADAFRMAAVECRLSEQNTRPKPKPEQRPVLDWRLSKYNTLGEMFKENESRPRRRWDW